MKIELFNEDCLAAMQKMPSNSVDSIVTDPPYGLSFMGKKWDYDVPSEAIWTECLRVLKPGGHLLAFAGTRTQHRMAVRIEDAGFEIRDMIAWVYGSGFPKSHDVSKAIDKAAGVERKQVPTIDGSDPGSDAAQQWNGWGTALKPALEPLTVARKPLIGTVADNVLAHGTGGINVDGCRVDPTNCKSGWSVTGSKASGNRAMSGDNYTREAKPDNPAGRWPANLIHDGSEEVLALFPETKSGATKPHIIKSVASDCVTSFSSSMEGKLRNYTRAADEGTAARFFYCAKASKKDRDEGLDGFEAKPAQSTGFSGDSMPLRQDGTERKMPLSKNIHPTVKPTELMRYLCRLVTPPGGTVLDPFMGSGSTGKAAKLEGFGFVGIEREFEYFNIAESRINNISK